MNASAPSDPVCPRCGRTIPATARHGLCPACLVATAVQSTPDEAEDSAQRVTPFGDYDLLEPLGRGATGAVWRARQRRTGRIVALKFLLAGTLVDESARARFEREARAIAALEHPNVVAIHEVGEQAGRPLLALPATAPPPLPLLRPDGQHVALVSTSQVVTVLAVSNGLPVCPPLVVSNPVTSLSPMRLQDETQAGARTFLSASNCPG